MVRTAIALVLGLGLGLVGAGDTRAADFLYVGVAKCKSCHKKELIGNQYGKWQEMKHAEAFETLKGEDALKIAKEKGLTKPPSEAEECLKCHATAFGLKPEQIAKKPLKLTDGVQCESCHGPGNKYKKKKTMADHDKAVAAGMWEPEEKTCTKCHNDESPTWDPNKYEASGFDYDKAVEEIAHAIPEDVKGKYIEIEKKRKAEKKAAGGGDDDDDEDEEE
jgi:hypothetical protein